MRSACAAFSSLVGLSWLAFGCAGPPPTPMAGNSAPRVKQVGAQWVADAALERWILLPLGSGKLVSPVWSPDRHYLLYAVRAAGRATPPGQEQTGEGPERTARSAMMVYEAASGQVWSLMDAIDPQFGWTADSRQLVTAMRADGSERLLWMAASGRMVRALTLPRKSAAVLGIVGLPGGSDIAFLMDDGPPNSPRINLYQTERNAIKPLTEAGGVLGAGVDTVHSGVLWMETLVGGKTIGIAVRRRDLVTGAVTKLPFPAALAARHETANSEGSPTFATFDRFGRRAAVVVQIVTWSGRPGETAQVRNACWVAAAGSRDARLVYRSPAEYGELVPSWSEDGRRLAIIDSGAGRTALISCSPDGADVRTSPVPDSPAVPIGRR